MSRVAYSQPVRAAVFAAAVSLICTGWNGAAARADDATAVEHARSLSRAFRRVAEAGIPSVVTVIAKTKPPTIRNEDQLRELLRDPRFRRLFPDGLPDLEIPDDGEGLTLPEIPGLTSSLGSGVVIDQAGTILTNNHVVQGADQVIVRLPDGQEFEATNIRTDPMSDLAIVTIKADEKIYPAKLGDSDDLAIGDWVLAIGSPFELEATVSAGIISGRGRGIEQIRRGKLIQTDAAINPGNSGGPLLNLDGQVIGINTAIATSNFGYQGVGFAIPINRAKWVAAELAEFGKVRRAYLGIRIDELTAAAAKKLGLRARAGALVNDVIHDSPSDRAGMARNDVIFEFAGQRIRGPRDLQDVVEQKKIGSTQPVKIHRDGKVVTLEVKMELYPDDR